MTINLNDRIKELSRTTGTGDFSLDEAATGFSEFSSVYTSGDRMWYAISDGTEYEIGSGVYKSDGATVELLERNAFRSTNSDTEVNFGVGLKEVYVTYPGQYSVFTANGVGDFNEPQNSGVAFWGSNHILDYDSDLVWNKGNDFLGFREPAPAYAIDIGGDESYSQMNVSGVVVGNSGIMFSGDAVSVRGRQTIPFQQNELMDDATPEDTNIQEVFQLSGIVNEYIGFNKQPKRRFFAGPSGDCGCVSDYPTFRPIELDDIGDLEDAISDYYADINLSSIGLSGNPPDFTVDQVVTNSGGLENTIVNHSGFLVVPTFDTVASVTGTFDPENLGAIAFAIDDSYIMIANGSAWVSGHLT